MLRMEAEELRWQETNNTALEASKSKKQQDPRFGPQLHSQVKTKKMCSDFSVLMYVCVIKNYNYLNL